MDVELEIRKLKEKINELDGENKKYRRLIEDTVNNIDMDNLSTSVKKEIKAAGENAEVKIIAEGIGKYDSDGNLTVSSATIIAAVNENQDSEVFIKADNIELEGIVRVSKDLVLGSGHGGSIKFDSAATIDSPIVHDDENNVDIPIGSIEITSNGFNVSSSSDIMLDGYGIWLRSGSSQLLLEGNEVNIKNAISDTSINGVLIPEEQHAVGSASGSQTISMYYDSPTSTIRFLVKGSNYERELAINVDYTDIMPE